VILAQHRRQARTARAVVEDALGEDVASWPWSPRLSRWIDALVVPSEVDE